MKGIVSMRRKTRIRRLAAVILSLIFSRVPYGGAAVVSPNVVMVSEDEREIEREREKAIFEALAVVDPAIKRPDLTEAAGEVNLSAIYAEVEQLRAARKSQFRYLTAGHIKEMITEDSVLAKEQFLERRDQQLGSVIQRAVEVYIPAQIARERVTLAKFRIAEAVRELLPEMKLTAELENGSLSGSAFEGSNWRMSFRQPLFRGGVLWNTLALERSNLEVAKREYDKSVSDLVSEASEAYFEFERTKNVFRDREDFFKVAEAQHSISAQKYESDLISEIEKLNTDSLFSQAQYDLETAQQELEVAKLELQKYLHLEIDDPVAIDPMYNLERFEERALDTDSKLKLPAEGQLTAGLNQFVELAYEHRSDLQVEAAKLKAAQYAYRVQVGKRLPSADFILEFGELGQVFKDLIDKDGVPHNTEFRLGLEVTWPLAGNTLTYTYDHDQRAPSVSQFLQGVGSRTKSNAFSVGFLDDLGQFSSLIEAKISALEQVVELEKTERDVVREVKEAYFNFNKAIIQVESTHKRMRYRMRLAELAKHRLEENEVEISEYLQAEIDLAEERALVYKALADFFLAKAKLNWAIGVRDYLTVEALETDLM